MTVREICDAIDRIAPFQTAMDFDNVGGAGGDYALAAQAKGADAFVTGEVKHHEAIAAQQAGLALYEAGHYHTELPYRERLKAYLDTACPGVEFIVSESERPPMETL